MSTSGEPTVWERIDERVMRWVASLPPSLGMDVYDLEVRDPVPFEPIEGLDSRAVDESLRRLVSHRLVDARSSDAMQTSMWSQLPRLDQKPLVQAVLICPTDFAGQPARVSLGNNA